MPSYSNPQDADADADAALFHAPAPVGGADYLDLDALTNQPMAYAPPPLPAAYAPPGNVLRPNLGSRRK